ncbi:MAG: DUF1349 domain-containing protein, partial [Caldilineaceae bacterium]
RFSHYTGYTALSLLHAELLLRHGLREEAIERLGNAFAAIPNLPGAVAVITCGEAAGMRLRRPLSEALSKLEAAYTDTDQFRAHCRKLRSEYADFAPSFTQWYLEQAAVDLAGEETSNVVTPENMTWIDPFADCAYSVDDFGIEIQAANGRELWMVNRSAPRLLMSTSGSFALQTNVSAARDDLPAMGGLLLWQDEENYLYLSWGERRPDEIGFEGCIDNEDLVFGRGKLPGDNIRLRLERRGDQVRALCSADGDTWYTAGQIEFVPGDELQAGFFASGHIDRSVTPGAFPDGTAIRFRSARIVPYAANSYAPELREFRPNPDLHLQWRYDAFTGLGRTYTGRSDMENAAEVFREALEMGPQLDIPAEEQAQLIAWLSDVLFWRSDYDTVRSLVEEGLKMVDEDQPSIARAMLNHLATIGSGGSGDVDWSEFSRIQDNLQYLKELPYLEELRGAHFSAVTLCLYHKDIAAAREW